MFFSPEAVEILSRDCKCPSHDSPDDMILGMCMSYLNIRMIHSAALHQARPMDYAERYVEKLKPVSFHKHYEQDPVNVFQTYLKEGYSDDTTYRNEL